MTHLVIKIYHPMLELIFWNYCHLWAFYVFPCLILRFAKAIFFTPLFKSNLWVSVSIKTCSSELLMASFLPLNFFVSQFFSFSYHIYVFIKIFLWSFCFFYCYFICFNIIKKDCRICFYTKISFFATTFSNFESI